MSTPQWFAEFEREEAKRMERIDRIKADKEAWEELVRSNMVLVECPQCEGADDLCQYCGGSGKTTKAHADEWRRQNP